MVTRTPHLINLLRGWPSPSLLPAAALTAAAARALSDPTISVPGLQYAPDPGFQPLREDLAAWLARGADVADRAKELGVTVGAGDKFEVAGDEDGARFEREVRICFSWEEVEDVVEGVRRLGHAVRDVQQGKFVAGRRVDATYIEK
ncbi:hypothetical protein VdG1_08607 [Verticillium dahliae VDG1]|nr:hypothetical protein VdG1_08607 [Verticillium dahliae VDG1]